MTLSRPKNGFNSFGKNSQKKKKTLNKLSGRLALSQSFTVCEQKTLVPK